MTSPQMRALRMGGRAAGSDAEPQRPGTGCEEGGGAEGLGHGNKRERRTHVPGGEERREEAVPFEGVRLRL